MSIADSNDTRPVVVFGATGLTGSLVVKDLLGRGMKVRAVVRSPEKAAGILQQSENLEVRRGDICNEESISEAVSGSQAVVWAAAGDPVPLWVGYLWNGEDVSSPYSVDYLGVKRAIDAAKSQPGFKRFVVLSGGLAGKSTHPIALIGNMLAGGGPYYKGLAEDYAAQSGVPYTVVRPAGRLHDEPLSDENGQAKMPKLAPREDSTFGPIGRQMCAFLIGEALQQPIADNLSFNVIDGEIGPKSELSSSFAWQLQSMVQ